MIGVVSDDPLTLGKRLSDLRYALVLIHHIMEEHVDDNVFDPTLCQAVARLAYATAENCSQLACALPPAVDEWVPPAPANGDEDTTNRREALARLSEALARDRKPEPEDGPAQMRRIRRQVDSNRQRARGAGPHLCAVPQPEPEGAS